MYMSSFENYLFFCKSCLYFKGLHFCCKCFSGLKFCLLFFLTQAFIKSNLSIFPFRFLYLLSFLNFVLVGPCFNYTYNTRLPTHILNFQKFPDDIFIFIALTELWNFKVIVPKKISIVIFVEIVLNLLMNLKRSNIFIEYSFLRMKCLYIYCLLCSSVNFHFLWRFCIYCFFGCCC